MGNNSDVAIDLQPGDRVVIGISDHPYYKSVVTIEGFIATCSPGPFQHVLVRLGEDYFIHGAKRHLSKNPWMNPSFYIRAYYLNGEEVEEEPIEMKEYNEDGW